MLQFVSAVMWRQAVDIRPCVRFHWAFGCSVQNRIHGVLFERVGIVRVLHCEREVEL